MTPEPVDPSVSPVPVDLWATIAERARIADAHGVLPAIAGRHWISLLAEVVRLRREREEARAENVNLRGNAVAAVRLLDRTRDDLAAARSENATLRKELDFQRRRADRLRAFVSSQAITARALGAGDWERRMLDTLHADDRSRAAAAIAAVPGSPDTPATGEHECAPTNEKLPRCVLCGREMTIREADRHWFANRRPGPVSGGDR